MTRTPANHQEHTLIHERSTGPRFPRAEWYGIAEAKGIGRRPVGLRRLGRRLVLWRDPSGTLVAQDAHCPHRGADLALGRVVDGCIECPWHGFQFRSDGGCALVPAEGREYRPVAGMKLRGHTVIERHGIVWMWDGPARDVSELPPLPWFPELPQARSMVASTSTVWPVPFARSAESMLDMNHAPFTHRRALPWLEPRMYDVEVERCDGFIRIRCRYGPDDSKKRTAVVGFSVHFPGLMMGEIVPRMKLLAVLSPVDDDTTHVISGYYVDHPLGTLRGHLQLMFDRWMVTPDDLRLMASVRPRHFQPRDFHYVPSDAAMLQWHAIARERARARRATP